MKKVILEDIDDDNEKKIKNYLSKNQKGFGINEYYYIQDVYVINDLLEKIKDKNVKDNSIFLTIFFWNHQPNEYQLAENCGKFFLRLSGFKDNNTIIETKELLLLEQINYLDNLNYICEKNEELKKMFELNKSTLSDKMIKLGRDTEFLEKIYAIYCNDWIDKNDMRNLIQSGIKFIESLELMRKIDNKMPLKYETKKYKI